jgi:hypothetical protein
MSATNRAIHSGRGRPGSGLVFVTIAIESVSR